MNVPKYWKGSSADIEKAMATIKKGEKKVLCRSAGGENIYAVQYGDVKKFNRKANFSSAAGAGDVSCYADKSGDYKKNILLVGTIHGAEFEGTVALLNLIQILETGRDFAMNEHSELTELAESVNICIIPSINPDGRKKVPFNSMVSKSYEDMRYYNQGTWADGSLAGWPECKKLHPMKGNVGYLGGYYNDDGINLMHDNFFKPMAEETKALFDLVDLLVPDITVLLHGGANCVNTLLKPAYAPMPIKKELAQFEAMHQKTCKKEGLDFKIEPFDFDNEGIKSFNLSSALTHLCGEPCVVYETNQGLNYGNYMLSYEEIYKHHLLLFKTLLEFYKNV